MWLLFNETPFAAERTWTRDEAGREFWLVAIKAAFEIFPDGGQAPLKEQIPVRRAPVFAGDPTQTELLEESDFNLEKTGTDVLVAGHAYVPSGKPAVETVVRMRLADLDKSLRVTGDRMLADSLVSIRPSRPQPFSRMPITWRRAFGGTDMQASKPAWEPRNPVGTGFAVESRHLLGRPAPNFEYPDAPYRGPANGRPAGLGPVARHWLPRLKHAGTYGTDWEENRDPLPPRDFDRKFYQCAPEDQQTRTPLVGFEHVQLSNLTSDGFQQFLLPRITFDLVTQFYNRPDRRHRATIHTLWLLPDQRRFVIVWLSALPCPYDEERLKGTTVRLKRQIGVPASFSATGVWIP
ncbi:hypothetical protein AWB67_06409 [Caballeronia terrestris]|uniref:DUF2169 domain-containing protein n=2 Tax=Caballeronia terrestris TaxID=1226301 RepID=A0A158KR18_9BURK|nr:hypothetical protein AWB67_06409 [Caballeronia terrestris]